jgi:deazaflavin-dependent oxidoreductase (nitroreductase family)
MAFEWTILGMKWRPDGGAGRIAAMPNTENAPKYQAPNAFEAMFNRTFGFLAGLGLAPKFIYLLEVRGRKSGKIYRSPVNLMEIGGKRILVAPRGRTQWVRNAEAAGEIVLKRASFRRTFALRAFADADKPPILKEYLDRYASAVKKFFPIPPGSPAESFRPIAANYPVFELVVK